MKSCIMVTICPPTIYEEELNEISFSKFLQRVDSKIWRLHLQSVTVGFLFDLTISEMRKIK